MSHLALFQPGSCFPLASHTHGTENSSGAPRHLSCGKTCSEDQKGCLHPFSSHRRQILPLPLASP